MEAIEVRCDGCNDRTQHNVLKQNGYLTVECRICGYTHKEKRESREMATRRVIVSQDGSDLKTSIDLPVKEVLRVGEERILDSEKGVFGVEITSLEVEIDGGDNERKDVSTVGEVDTIWTKVIDNVKVPLTINLDNGESRSVDLTVPRDYRFRVGEREELEDESFRVTAFINEKGDRFRLEGDDVLAKNTKRLYARE